MAFGFQPRGMLVHWATDFVQDVLKLGRLRKGPLPVMTGSVRGHLVSSHPTMVPLLSTEIC